MCMSFTYLQNFVLFFRMEFASEGFRLKLGVANVCQDCVTKNVESPIDTLKEDIVIDKSC